MKKILTSFLMLVLTASLAMAAPANPAKYKYVQPDGTVIWLQNHGDEHYHWTTDDQGNVVAKDADGYYRISSMPPRETSRGADDILNRAWSSYDNPNAINFGDRKVLAIMVNYSDVHFTVPSPRQAFDNLLNQQGYSYNGAHGSVRDYYLENSHNQYRPSFDVYGPVTLPHSMLWYDDDNSNGGAGKAIMDALGILGIDVSQYDTDNDGAVDIVIMYYAGYNEAEGGGEDTIWPHQSWVGGYYGGKYIGRYFCTSEYSGEPRENPTMAGIGTTCHEFAHALGLPDMYDTNYETFGQNDMTTGRFDLMASGNYNDSGRMPPYLSAVERNMLGWMDYPAMLSGSGNYTLAPVSENAAYRSDANTQGEYYVYEYRPKSGWDTAIGNGPWESATDGGLLIYHVDKSSRYVLDSGLTAKYLWESTNAINAYGGHPCYYLKTSYIPDQNDYTFYRAYHFPGPANVTTYTPLDWDSHDSGIRLENIAVDGTKATFSVSTLGTHILQGVVSYESAPVSGATVTLTAYGQSTGGASAVSEADGSYHFDLAGNNNSCFIVTVYKDGYVSRAVNVAFPLENSYAEQDFQLELFPQAPTLDYYGNASIDMNVDIPVVSAPTNKTLVSSVTWKVDGHNVSNPTSKTGLSAGQHEYTATLNYCDGTWETVYYFVNK